MRTYLFEASNNDVNWGKFVVGVMDVEWGWRSRVKQGSRPLLAECGWGRSHIWVMDLQTGEGALFWPGGSAHADLNAHRVWVCPLFEPFLEWLYQQDLEKLDALCAEVVRLPNAPAALRGHRRPGPVGVVGAQGQLDEAFDDLLDQSSVGTPVSRAIQALSPPEVHDRLDEALGMGLPSPGGPWDGDQGVGWEAPNMYQLWAPFTGEQVAGLNAFQAAPNVHPFTCGNDSSHPVLVASTNGWHCEACDYTQVWAHAAMADGRLTRDSAEAVRRLQQRSGGDG